ncbi:GTP-binding protein [Prochlorococcus sp. MIT 1307]|uniref:YcjF family protein n=1 Tax=Prochlorococcus sp. MIT 1307 TaxID=3096219 RepID=UPI002A74C446|nr:GTP-binding protein [Prochlorococcus sp. MIT 1307]
MNRQKLLIYSSGGLILLLLTGAVIGGFLRLINEVRYSLEYFLPYWLVGPVLFLAGCLLLALIIQVGWPWFQSFLNKISNQSINSKSQTLIPKNRHQAAKQSLKSIDRLLERLQDNVATEGLRQDRDRVEKELARGDLVVVIFGTGSSGKTSLIRAILNEVVGRVGAQMGSTKSSQIYRLRLKRLDRGLKLIDTPGILEAGKDGYSREKEARLRASSADLMVVVVDSDLRSAELEVIKSLTNLGKRLLIVLNKCDLRGEEEERRLLALLRRHCKGLVDSEDVIPCCASPQSVPIPGEQPWQPPAEINKLLRRLAKVLHDDGEELLADNILLQCRNLGDKGKKLLNSQRKQVARKCVDRYSWISSGVVVATPLPGADLLVTAAVNAQMVIEVARIYGVQLTKDRAQELTVSVGRTLAGLGIIKGGVSLIGSALSINLPSLLVGKAIQGIAAAWLTRIAGASFITYFQQDQDWGDGGIQEVVQHHYDLNKRDSSLQKFMELAVRRVIVPLRKNQQRQLPPRPGLREGEGASDHEHLKP